MNDKRKPLDPQRTIDESLRQVYSEIDNEGVPDRFRDLLQSLRDKDAAASGQGGSDDG